MIECCKIKVSYNSPFLYLKIFFFCESKRGIFTWDVWNLLIKSEKSFFYNFKLTLMFCYFIFQFLSCLYRLFRWFLSFSRLRNLISLSSKIINLFLKFNSFAIKMKNLIYVYSFYSFILECMTNNIRIFTKYFYVYHKSIFRLIRFFQHHFCLSIKCAFFESLAFLVEFLSFYKGYSHLNQTSRKVQLKWNNTIASFFRL